MKIAVIAAQGRSGRAFVAAALAAGHEVVAGIRTDDPFAAQARLVTMPTDATDPAAAARLIAGCDAVVSLLGHTRRSRGDVQTHATSVLVAAMAAAGIKRVVSLTGTGVRRPSDVVPLLDRLANFAIARIDPERITDGIRHAAVLEASGLDYTIVRVLKLTGGGARPFKLLPHGPAALATSRATVAQAVLATLTDPHTIKALPAVGRA